MDYSESIGTRAYTAYGKVTDFKNFLGNAMPTWEELPPKIREAWEAAASEIYSLAVSDFLDEDV